MEYVVALLAGALAYVAARSIIAESDAHRLELPDSWWSPRCPECGGGVSWNLSTCAMHGHPQRASNAWVWALTTLVLGLMMVGSYSSWVMPAYLVFGYTAVLLTVTDLDTKLIPNRILGPATVIGVVLLGIGAGLDGELPAFLRALLAGVAYFAVMLVLGLVARGALGFGDVKLAFLLGVFTGYLGWGHVLVAILLAFIIGGVVSLVLLVTGRAGRKDSIPFGPFLVAGAIIAVVAGQAIIDWYIG